MRIGDRFFSWLRGERWLSHLIAVERSSVVFFSSSSCCFFVRPAAYKRACPQSNQSRAGRQHCSASQHRFDRQQRAHICATGFCAHKQTLVGWDFFWNGGVWKMQIALCAVRLRFRLLRLMMALLLSECVRWSS